MRLTKFITFCLPIVLSMSAFAQPLLSTYQFKFTPQASMHWQLAQAVNDNSGYLHYYVTKNELNATTPTQSMLVNYGRGIHTPLKASMQEVINVISHLDCQYKATKVLRIKKDQLIFLSKIDGCTNGEALLQVFNVFNKADGQYTLNYTANMKIVSLKTISMMQDVVIKAKLQ